MLILIEETYCLRKEFNIQFKIMLLLVEPFSSLSTKLFHV